MLKRISLILLAVIFIITSFGLVGCTSKVNEDKLSSTAATDTASVSATPTAAPETPAKLFDKPITLKMFTGSHASWPFKADWWILGAIQKATNVTLDVTAYGEEYPDKIQLAIASGELPDILYCDMECCNKYALDGPFAAVSDKLDKLPNLNKWCNTSETNKNDFKAHASGDGKVYIFPTIGGFGDLEMGWLIRMDILQKNNLHVPTNSDELYAVLTALKKAYPDSYPLCFRGGFKYFKFLGPQWSTDMDAYYDFAKNEWRYGPIEDNYKEMVIYLRKLHSEGLIPPDILTIKTKAWEGLMGSSKSFVTFDYITRLDFFNIPMRKENPDANMDWMIPPKGGANGVNLFPKLNFNGGGNVVCNTKNTEAAMKFVDWMYSDEASEIQNWGKEGETYKVVNGEKQIILDKEGSSKESLYGLLTFGFNINMDNAAAAAQFKGQVLDGINNYYKHCADNFNPKLWLAFTKDETDEMTRIKDVITTTTEENISKFITGESDISGWDAYVAKIKGLSLDKYLALYEKAYNRVK